MSTLTEQFSAVTKSQLEAQLQLLNTLASNAVLGTERLIALNLSTSKAAVEQSSSTAKKLLDVQDGAAYFKFSASEPAHFDGWLAYGRELHNIAAGIHSSLLQTAQHTFQQLTELATAPVTAIQPVVKSAPPRLALAKPAAAVAEVAVAEVAVAEVLADEVVAEEVLVSKVVAAKVTPPVAQKTAAAPAPVVLTPVASAPVAEPLKVAVTTAQASQPEKVASKPKPVAATAAKPVLKAATTGKAKK